MTAQPEVLRGRHLDASRPVEWIVRDFDPGSFMQWMLVLCLALTLWPATLGGRFGMVMVAGNSMEPTYELGDAVITWREEVRVGDVILYQVPKGGIGEGNPVIHRVVGGGPGGWVTRGDNAAQPDSWTPSNRDVLGVAKVVIPLGGRVLALMRSWLFVATLGGLAAGLLLWPEDPERSVED
jgi:signal peptidase